MKKFMHSNVVLSLFAFLITAAPLMDMSTRCGWGLFGEPEYPEK